MDGEDMLMIAAVLLAILLILFAVGLRLTTDTNAIAALDSRVRRLETIARQDSIMGRTLYSNAFDSVSIVILAQRSNKVSWSQLQDSLMTKLYGNRWRRKGE